ncbi:hypothetical protein HAX54_052637 [Datura stramonium]|uniref:Uncharacterized protein n=1 Tax=Datura stramonium TaxID=4076 RepID=A0ABS8RRS2_DATST|nr:hypothetical protein [Datura stramonium]
MAFLSSQVRDLVVSLCLVGSEGKPGPSIVDPSPPFVMFFLDNMVATEDLRSSSTSVSLLPSDPCIMLFLRTFSTNLVHLSVSFHQWKENIPQTSDLQTLQTTYCQRSVLSHLREQTRDQVAQSPKDQLLDLDYENMTSYLQQGPSPLVPWRIQRRHVPLRERRGQVLKILEGMKVVTWWREEELVGGVDGFVRFREQGIFKSKIQRRGKSEKDD